MKYDANETGFKFKIFNPHYWPKVYEFEQGKQYNEKYHFYFMKYIVLYFNIFQLDYYLRFHLKENFNSDFDDFAEFIKLCIWEHSTKLFTDEFQKNKITYLEEWIAKGPPAKAIKNDLQIIRCVQNASGLLSLFKDLSERFTLGKNHKIIEIENGTIQDFIYTNFHFPKKNSTPLTNDYIIRWNESKGSLITLFSYLNKSGYFAPAQKNKIIDFLRREFGSEGLSEDNVKSYWSRINPHEKPLKKLVDALGISLSYYTSR